MEITFISDTHGLISEDYARKELTRLLPGGQTVVHAGDVSDRGTYLEIKRFMEWFSTLPYTNKVMIAGNHDFFFEVAGKDEISELLAEYPDVIYLNDSGVTIDGIKFWGSPITPYFHNWAFNRMIDTEIQEHWDLIPTDTDVLITHGPAYGILDQVFTGGFVGCPKLLEKIKEVKPQVHVFGHIHESRGYLYQEGTHYINASAVSDFRTFTKILKPMTLEIISKNLV